MTHYCYWRQEKIPDVSGVAAGEVAEAVPAPFYFHCNNIADSTFLDLLWAHPCRNHIHFVACCYWAKAYFLPIDDDDCS